MYCKPKLYFRKNINILNISDYIYFDSFLVTYGYICHRFNPECNGQLADPRDNIFTISSHLTLDAGTIERHLRDVRLRYSAAQANGLRKISYRESCRDFVFDNPLFETTEELEDDAFLAAEAGSIQRREDTREQFSDLNGTHHLNSYIRHYETWPSPQTRRRSVKRAPKNNVRSFSTADSCTNVNQQKLSTHQMIVNEIQTPRCRKCSDQSAGGSRRSVYMKDNRLKSNIREHTMRSVSRRMSHRLDDSTVEALSKEDLLVLWKRSEIELQTKLNRILHQNSHLRHLIDMSQESEPVTQTGSDVDEITDNDIDTRL